MKKHYLSIDEYENPKGTHTIIINNIRYHNCFYEAIKKIINSFIVDDELFFGFYRVDGFNLTFEQQKKLKSEIPMYFQNQGEFCYQNKYLAVAKLKVNNDIYNFIPLVFDYYLETIVFNSKVSWEDFEQYHLEYLHHRYDDYILKGFTDFLFSYVDSGDFFVCFNPKKFNSSEVRVKIDRIIFE